MPIRFAYTHWYGLAAGYPDPENFYRRMGDMAGMGTPYFWQAGVGLGSIDSGPPRFCSTMEAPKEFKDMERCVLEPGNDYAKAIRAALLSHLRFVVNHDYGDKTMDYVMDIMDQVQKEDPAIDLNYIKSLRITADHCGFYPRDVQIPRMVKNGMIISCDSMFVNRSAPWLDVYGKDKANRIAPIADMIKGGLMTVAEAELSDVESGTSETLHAQLSHLIHRTNDRGEKIAPEEGVDRNTLMKMSTTWASHYVIKEKEIGTLEPGKYADFVILSKDYFTIPEGEITSAIPLATFLNGKESVLRKELADEWGVQPIGPQLNFKFATEFASGGGEG